MRRGCMKIPKPRMKPEMPSCKVPKVKDNKPYLYDKIIYVAGKYQGKPENLKYIEDCCRAFSKCFPKFLFINGVSQFGYLYEELPMLQGLEMCLKLMSICDEVWTVGQYENSVGTNCEICTAKALGIPVKEHADIVNNIDVLYDVGVQKEKWVSPYIKIVDNKNTITEWEYYPTQSTMWNIEHGYGIAPLNGVSDTYKEGLSEVFRQ